MKYVLILPSRAYWGFYHIVFGHEIGPVMDVTTVDFGTAEEIGQIMGGNWVDNRPANWQTLFIMFEDSEDHVATGAESLAEFARNAGQDNQDIPWLLDSRDVWVKNPFYSGPPAPHPEDDYYPEEEKKSWLRLV